MIFFGATGGGLWYGYKCNDDLNCITTNHGGNSTSLDELRIFPCHKYCFLTFNRHFFVCDLYQKRPLVCRVIQVIQDIILHSRWRVFQSKNQVLPLLLRHHHFSAINMHNQLLHSYHLISYSSNNAAKINVLGFTYIKVHYLLFFVLLLLWLIDPPQLLFFFNTALHLIMEHAIIILIYVRICEG